MKSYDELLAEAKASRSSRRSLGISKIDFTSSDTPTDLTKQVNEGESSSLLGTTGSAISSFGGEFIRGAADSVANVPTFLGASAERIEESITGETFDPEDSSLMQLGEGIRDFATSVTPDFDPQFNDTWGGYAKGIASGLGQLAVPIAGKVAGMSSKAMLATGIATGASGGFKESFDDYLATPGTSKENGLPDYTRAFTNGLFGAGISSVTEAMPLARLLNRLDDKTGGSFTDVVKAGAKGFGEEGLTEAADQALKNLVASDVLSYDTERGVYKDVVDAGVTGGGVGLIANALAKALGGRKLGKIETAVAENSEAPVEDGSKRSLNPSNGSEFINSDVKRYSERLHDVRRALNNELGDSSRKSYEAEHNSLMTILKGMAADPTEVGAKGDLVRSEAKDVVNFDTTNSPTAPTDQVNTGTGTVVSETEQEQADRVDQEEADAETDPAELAAERQQETIDQRRQRRKDQAQSDKDEAAAEVSPEEEARLFKEFQERGGSPTSPAPIKSTVSNELELVPLESETPAKVSEATKAAHAESILAKLDEDVLDGVITPEEYSEAATEIEPEPIAPTSETEPTVTSDTNNGNYEGLEDHISPERVESVSKIQSGVELDSEETSDVAEAIIEQSDHQSTRSTPEAESQQAADIEVQITAEIESMLSRQDSLLEARRKETGDLTTQDRLAITSAESISAINKLDRKGLQDLADKAGVLGLNRLSPDSEIRETMLIEAKNNPEVADILSGKSTGKVPTKVRGKVASKAKGPSTRTDGLTMGGVQGDKPFKTKASAKSVQTRRNLKDSHVVVKVDGGYALSSDKLAKSADQSTIDARRKREDIESDKVNQDPMEAELDALSKEQSTDQKKQLLIDRILEISNKSDKQIIKDDTLALDKSTTIHTDAELAELDAKKKLARELSREADEIIANEQEGFDEYADELYNPVDTGGSYQNRLDPTSIFNKAGDFTGGDAAYKEQVNLLRDTFNKLIGTITNPEVRNSLKSSFILDMESLEVHQRTDSTGSSISNPLALGWRGTFNTRTGTVSMNPHVFVNDVRFEGNEAAMVEAFTGTFMHELVGHYGVRRILGTGYDSFLDGVIADKRRAADIWELRSRWSSYKPRWSDTVTFRDINGESVTANKDLMRQYADEYVAEKARLFGNKEMADRHGKSDVLLFHRVIVRVKHLLRRFFGFKANLTDTQVMAMVADSYHNIYGSGAVIADITAGDINSMSTNRTDAGANAAAEVLAETEFSKGNYFGQEFMDPSSKENKEYDGTPVRWDWQLTPDQMAEAKLSAIKAAYNSGVPMSEITATLAAMNDGYGKMSANAASGFGAKVWTKFQSQFPRLYQTFNTDGGIRNHKAKQLLSGKTLGKVGKSDKLMHDAAQVFDKMNRSEKDAAVTYLQTRDADVDALTMSEDNKKNLKLYKETIADYGDRLVQLGLLDPEVHSGSRGKYLPTRYLASIASATGGGKKASPLNYLRKKGDLSTLEKKLLGEVEDPSQFVPEVLGLIGRDVALLEYTRMISDLSSSQDLGWVLGNQRIVLPDGTKTNVVGAEKRIETWNKILVDYAKFGRDGLTQSTKEDIELITRKIDETQGSIDTYKDELAEIIKKKSGTDQAILPEDFRDALGNAYKKLPKDPGYGSLAGEYVRREIYDEFIQPEAMSKDLSFVAKMTATGGYLERGNQFWKQMMVPFNAPSWVRNFSGNIVLMDIATSTPLYSMAKKMVDDVTNKGTSKYWNIAHDYGLFGTTFSSQELYLTNGQHAGLQNAQIKREIAESEKWYQSSALRAKATFMILSEKASDGYGGMEGMFKTALLRDHIEQWEASSGLDIDKIDSAKREAVIAEAVSVANQALFDYSDIPGWWKDIRRNAIGAPFLTYTMKAGPAVVRGLARNPQKFIKYAALPAIMAQAAVSSLGDFSDEEIEEFQRNQLQYMKEKSSVLILPTRDANGKIVPVDWSYILPWAPWQAMALKSINAFEGTDSLEDMAIATTKAGMTVPEGMGLLGGPIPKALAGIIMQKDTFFGKDISDSGDSGSVALAKWFNWTMAFAVPPWLTNSGVAGKLMDHYDVSLVGTPNKNFDAFGGQKRTLTEEVFNGLGFGNNPISNEELAYKRNKQYSYKVSELTKTRRKVVLNPGWSDVRKAKEVADINRRIIALSKRFEER